MKFAKALSIVGFLEFVSASCNCKDVSSSFLVTRLWNIDGDLTPEQVIEEFKSGFSGEVQAFSGFQEYLGASTGDDGTVFFMNIFETADRAEAAQSAAAAFVSGGSLNGQISENTFTQVRVPFLASSFESETFFTS